MEDSGKIYEQTPRLETQEHVIAVYVMLWFHLIHLKREAKTTTATICTSTTIHTHTRTRRRKIEDLVLSSNSAKQVRGAGDGGIRFDIGRDIIINGAQRRSMVWTM